MLGKYADATVATCVNEGTYEADRLPRPRTPAPPGSGRPQGETAVRAPRPAHVERYAEHVDEPFADYHLIYAVVLIALAAVSAGDVLGLGRLWARLPCVRDHKWLH
ncbi:hypothetical protein QFZ64_006325 [Streptomyces sp. B3I8]|nr:hypothetical protein [Streptomyces sp. B3I8]